MQVLTEAAKMLIPESETLFGIVSLLHVETQNMLPTHKKRLVKDPQ